MRIFVYGTLRAGGDNHRLLHAAIYEGAATLRGPYRLVDLGPFPGLIEASTQCDIVGEVYRVDPFTLHRVDRLEGHPLMYRRRPVRLLDGSVAETYLYPSADAAGYDAIASGDWHDRRT